MYIPYRYIRNPEQARRDFKKLSPFFKFVLIPFIVVFFISIVIIGTLNLK